MEKSEKTVINGVEFDESTSSIQQTVEDKERTEQETKKGKESLLSLVKDLNFIRFMMKYPKTSAVILVLMVGIAKEALIHLNPNKNLITNINGDTYYNLNEAMKRNIFRAYKIDGAVFTEVGFDEFYEDLHGKLNEERYKENYALELTDKRYGWIGTDIWEYEKRFSNDYSFDDSKGMMVSPMELQKGEEKPLEEVDNNIYFHEDEYEVGFTVDKLKKMLGEKDCKILRDYDSYTYADGSSIEFQDNYSVFKGLGGFICPMSDHGEEVSKYNQGYVIWKSYDKIDRVMLHDGTLIQWYQIGDKEHNGMNLYRYITSDGLTCNVEVTPKGSAISFETADGKTILPITTRKTFRVDWLNEKGEKIGYKEYGTHYVTWHDLEGREVYCEGISVELAEKTEYKDDGTEIVTDMIDGTVRIDKDDRNYSQFNYANGRSVRIFHTVDSRGYHPYAIVLYDANGIEIANKSISSQWVIVDGGSIKLTNKDCKIVEIISYGKYDVNLVDDGQYFGKTIPGTDDYDADFAISSDDEAKKS